VSPAWGSCASTTLPRMLSVALRSLSTTATIDRSDDSRELSLPVSPALPHVGRAHAPPDSTPPRQLQRDTRVIDNTVTAAALTDHVPCGLVEPEAGCHITHGHSSDQTPTYRACTQSTSLLLHDAAALAPPTACRTAPPLATCAATGRAATRRACLMKFDVCDSESYVTTWERRLGATS
jgi:hypothetical protein